MKLVAGLLAALSFSGVLASQPGPRTPVLEVPEIGQRIQPVACNDTDADGYGSPGDPGCPAGPETDCDDANNTIHPRAVDICNALDDDCDGGVDNASASPAWTAESNQAGGVLGSSVATAGDVNGDGYDDVIVGAAYYANGQTYEGRAFVYHGSAAGLTTSPAWTAEGDQTDAYFGSSVAPAGDVNGDGYDDVIVGAEGYDNGQTDEGRAYLYLGSASGLAASPAWTTESNQAGAFFGRSVATAGDVNGDGHDDVIVGAFQSDVVVNGNEGRAFVYHGSAAGLAPGPAWQASSGQASAHFGISVATAGDINGDGYADVIVGAQWHDGGEENEGGAFVYIGSAAGLSANPAWTAESDQFGAEFGCSVSSAGDVNGDGYDDVIVGARSHDGAQIDEGRAFAYHGSAAGLSTNPAWVAESGQDQSYFGGSVATAGDVNGDGYADIIVGAHQYENGEYDEGRAFVYYGSSVGLATGAAWTAESNQASADFGLSVAPAGDVNDDGYTDVIIGATRYTNGETAEGRTFLYLRSGGLGETTCGVGACRRTMANCVNGTAQPCGPGSPVPETCNEIDDDCDLGVDEGFDTDADGYTSCGGDCNDGNAAIHPGATEICNSVDDDCDSAIDEGDADADGYSFCAGDCDDSHPAIHPGAIEVCNAVDDDCNFAIDDGDVDTDGYSFCGGDCNDSDPAVHPGAAETCNSVDDDCDGLPDDAPVPVGSPALALAPSGSDTELSWNAIQNANSYDVVRGDLGILRSSAGDFRAAADACEDTDRAATTLTVSGSPGPGSGYFYLVRGRSCGGPGTYDSASPPQLGSRDPEVNTSASSCPFLYIVQVVADPSVVLTDTESAVRIEALVPAVPASDPAGVHLTRLASPGSLCTLLDNGNIANGDDVAGDRLFSCIVSFLEPQPTRIDLRVESSAGSSATFAVSVFAPLTIEEATTILTVQQAAADTWEQMRGVFGNTLEARVHTAAAVAELGGVLRAGVATDNVTVWIAHASGVSGGLMLGPPGTIGGASRAGACPAPVPLLSQETMSSPMSSQASLVDRPKILIWNAFLHGEISPASTVRAIFEAAECPGYDVTPLSGTQCTVESVRDFASYGTVIIATHGATSETGDPVFLTGERATPSSIITRGISLLSKSSGVYTGGEENVFAIGPEFISRIPGHFDDAIILNSSCRSAFTNTMSDAFLRKGAKTYFGYTEYTPAYFAAGIGQVLFAALVQQHASTGGAYDAATPHTTGLGYCSNNLDELCTGGGPIEFKAPSALGGPCAPPGECLLSSIVLRGSRTVAYPSPSGLNQLCDEQHPCCENLNCIELRDSAGLKACIECPNDMWACDTDAQCCNNYCRHNSAIPTFHTGHCDWGCLEGASCTTNADCCAGCASPIQCQCGWDSNVSGFFCVGAY